MMLAPSTLIARRVERVAATSCAWCQGDGVARIAGVIVVCACRPFDLDTPPDGASFDASAYGAEEITALSGARC